MASLKTGTTIAGQTAWHANNDGTGSTMDADTVDGVHAAGLRRTTVSGTAPSTPITGQIWVNPNETLLTDSDWYYPTFLNGWTNYGGGWSVARYCKLMGGLIYVEGLIASGTNGAAAWVFPVGFRPAYYIIARSLHSEQLASIFHVYPDGSMIPYWTNAGGSNAWHSVHGCFFQEA